MEKKWLLLALFLLASCGNNNAVSQKESSIQKEKIELDKELNSYFNYNIGLNESIYFSVYIESDELDKLVDSKKINLNNVTVTNEVDNESILIECENNEISNLKIICKEIFDNINFTKLVYNFDNYILEVPCEMNLKYNKNYDVNQKIIQSPNYYGAMTGGGSSAKTGLQINFANEKGYNVDALLLGIDPFYIYGVDQDVELINIEQNDNKINIDNFLVAKRNINNNDSDQKDLKFQQLTYPYIFDTSSRNYTYIAFEVTNEENFFSYGCDLKFELSINGDSVSNYLHVLVCWSNLCEDF